MKPLWPVWITMVLVLAISVIALRYFHLEFSHEIALGEMPILAFVSLYCAIGILFVFALPRLVGFTSFETSYLHLAFILVSGLLLRLAMFDMPALLEDDYNRYLWDGAVTANGENPYTKSPRQVSDIIDNDNIFYRLREEAGAVFERINYPEFSTVYPPVAQIVFAAAYLLNPFDLDMLRLVLLICEIGCVILILKILLHLKKPLIWVAFYWLNPLVLKEVGNSAHMEPILLLPVLGACYLALKDRLIFSSSLLAVAAGVKVWPILLIAPILRQMLNQPKRLIVSVITFSSILMLMIAPILLPGSNEHSGFIAFGNLWQASSAAYLVAEFIAELVWPYWLDVYLEIPQVARLLLASCLVVFIGWLCLKCADDSFQVLKRMFLIITAIYLLAPSHAPWYFIWIAPLLCIFPIPGLMLAGALIPLHYSFFYFNAHGMADFYHNGIVWVIWLPVWATLSVEYFSLRLKNVRQESLA